MSDCDCGCGVPAAEDTLPGDARLFRHSALRARMLARVSRAGVGRPLAGLATHDLADTAVALVDAAAGAAHVLGWVIGRLHADSTLALGEDPAALAGLTGLLGHQPRPAISAATLLAFTHDDIPGAPAEVVVPAGARVASTPAPGAQPVIFETDAPLAARPEWNQILPWRAPLLPVIDATTTEVTLADPAIPARPGDTLLIPSADGWRRARVAAVAPDPAADPPRTVVTLGENEGPFLISGFGLAADTVVLLGARMQPFGANAPDLRLYPDTYRSALVTAGQAMPTEWPDLKMEEVGLDGGALYLEALCAAAMPGRAALFSAGAAGQRLGRITAAQDTARTACGLSAKCTRIEVSGLNLQPYQGHLRKMLIEIETARAPLLRRPSEAPIGFAARRLVVLGTPALPAGRKLIATGQAASGATLARAVTVQECAPLGDGRSEITIEETLSAQWLPGTLALAGNCVSASEGTSNSLGAEVLGSGDPAQVLPRFALARAPLAHVAAPGPRGYAPALEIRVGDRLYERADSLWGEGAESRRYAVMLRDGAARIQFAGRLPAGTDTITARYRMGGGAAGNLPAGALSMLMSPQPGLRGVSNPLPAEGGSDPESADAIRQNAPKAVRRLDRIVSVSDAEAFAEGFRGVGKAWAIELNAGMRRVLCLTVATVAGAPPGAALAEELRAALIAAAAPGLVLRIAGFSDMRLVVDLALATDPALPRETVEAAVRAALAARFGRAAMRFGQGLHRSEIIAAAQDVPGVVTLRLTEFLAHLPGGVLRAPDQQGRILPPAPQITAGGTLAETGLLSLAAEDVTFGEMQP